MMHNSMETELNSLRNQILKLKEKLDKIPMPFKFLYKPPGEDVHWNLVEYLDSIDARLRKLEDGSTDRA